MGGWQFGGWPPPPPALDTVTFAEVKAALALADSAVGFNGQPLTNIGRSAARNSAALLDESFSVYDMQVPWPVQAPSAVVLAGAFATIPAPAAGFLRVLHAVRMVSLGATPNYNVTLEPSGLFVCGRATSGGAATSAPAPGGLLFSMLPFTAAETVKVANGGTASATLTYWYSDVLALNRTVVRAQFAANPGNAEVVVIPAAPSGFRSRWLWLGRQSGLNLSVTPQATVFNDDTAAVVTDWLQGGLVVDRNAAVAAGAQGTVFSSGGFMQVTTDALSVKAQAAATDATRRPIILGCYETLPIV